MLVWSPILGFAVDGEDRSIAAFQRTYEATTNQTVARSSFYDRFTPQLRDLLSDLLAHALEEVAVPHTVAPQLEQFRETLIADATVSGCIGSSRSFQRLMPVNLERSYTSSTTSLNRNERNERNEWNENNE